MTPPTNPARVLLLCDPGSTQEQITTALKNQPEFNLVDVLDTSENLPREINRLSPSIVILDSVLGGQPTLDIMDELAAQFPEIALISILTSADTTEAQQVMLAGARAFIIQPFTQINLLSTMRRVYNLETRRAQVRTAAATRPPDITHPVRVITVFSPRGGSGTSTVAANLAVAIQLETGMRTLLLEGKLFFGHLDVMLNIRNQNTISDLVPHATNLDEALVREIAAEHATGIEVLLAPSSLQVAQGIRPEDMYNVFMNLNRQFDYIIIDAGSALNENTVTLLDIADRALVVTNPDLAALHDISRFIQLTWTLSYAPDKILIVLNRAGIPGGIRSADIGTALRQNVFAQIPDEGPKGLRAINSGEPLIARYPRSPAAKAFQTLAKELLKLSASSPAARGSASEGGRDALQASSQFG